MLGKRPMALHKEDLFCLKSLIYITVGHRVLFKYFLELQDG